jgi:uncharacterized LabA/DUF88 family protein
MPKRVIVFIDYQNAYRGARAAFHNHTVDPHYFGQFHPVLLAQHLAEDAREARTLQEVRIYRGLPSSSRDSKSYGAARRQISAWERDPRVTVLSRPIRYPDGWPGSHAEGERPQEKGIDVALALDFAIMGHEERYDVGLMFSADTDLKPALEYIADKRRAWGHPIPEVAAWSSTQKHSQRLSLKGADRNVYCHWVDQTTYERVRDNTNYALAR